MEELASRLTVPRDGNGPGGEEIEGGILDKGERVLKGIPLPIRKRAISALCGPTSRRRISSAVIGLTATSQEALRL